MYKTFKVQEDGYLRPVESNSSGVFRVNINNKVALATTDDVKPTIESTFIVRLVDRVNGIATTIEKTIQGNKLLFYNLL